MASGSIYQLLQSPQEQKAKRLQVRSLLDEQAMRGLQRQQAEQGMADEQEVRRLSAEAGGDLGKLSDLLGQRGLYKPQQQVRQQLTAQQTAEAALGKTRAETGNIESQAQTRNFELAIRLLAGVRDQAGYDAWQATLPALGVDRMIRPGSIPAAFDPQWQVGALSKAEDVVRRMTPQVGEVNDGKNVRFVDRNPVTNPAITSTTIAMQTTPGQDQDNARTRELALLADERARTEGAANRGVTIRGQNMTDARAREMAAITRDGKSPNDSQGKAILFGARMAAADRALEDLAKSGTEQPSLLRRGAASLPLVSGAAGMAANRFASPAQQQVEQAQRDFINAVLRRESGAVIADSEFANAAQQYFPQPNDSKAVKEQKARNRRIAIEGIRSEAGQFAGEIDRIASRNAAPAAATGGATGGWTGAPAPAAPAAAGGWTVEPVR